MISQPIPDVMYNESINLIMNATDTSQLKFPDFSPTEHRFSPTSYTHNYGRIHR